MGYTLRAPLLLSTLVEKQVTLLWQGELRQGCLASGCVFTVGFDPNFGWLHDAVIRGTSPSQSGCSQLGKRH